MILRELTCQIGNLASAASVDIVIATRVGVGIFGMITNTATVTGSEEDPVEGNNSSSVSVTAVLTGDLNGDGVLDATDLFQLVQELNDGDGELVENVADGTFPGNAAFDVDGNGLIDQADLVSLAQIALDKLPTGPQEQFLLGSAAAGSVLNFPRLTFAAGKLTGVAISNPSPTLADVLLTAYDQDGRVLASSSEEIPAGRQFSKLTFELFGNLPASTIGWFQATSSTPGLAGFFLDLNGVLTELDGADIPPAARRIVFNKIRVEEGFETELNVVNTGSQDTEVLLALVGGPAVIERGVEIPSMGLVRVDAALPIQAYVTASAGQPVVGFETVRTTSGDFEGLNAQSALSFLNKIYIPQIAVGDPFESTIGLVNYSQQPTLVTLTAHQANGDLFIDGTGENPVTRLLQPGESLLEDVVEMFQFDEILSDQGWMEIISTSQAINGYFSYRLPAFGAAAAVAAVAEPSTTALFSHLATVPGLFFTGVAALNPSSFPANIRILAVSTEGQVLGSFNGILPPGERISKLITELIADSAGQNGGFIFVRSNVPIFLTALFGKFDLQVLANVPPQQVPSTFRPDAAAPQVRVVPPINVLQPGATTQFQAQGLAGSFEWSVNGMMGGSADVGTIDSNGLYTAPEAQPAKLPVTVVATGTSAAASASVDVIAAQTLLGNLGVVQSLSFLNSLQRLYTAEFSVGGGGPAATSPAGPPFSEIFASTPDDRSSLIRFDGDEIRKIVPFSARDGNQYLLASGGFTGQIYRIDPQNGTVQIVTSGLSSPGVMVEDPLTGDLLVAVTGQLSTVPKAMLEQGLATGPAAVVEYDQSRLGVMTNLDGITGIGVDACTGNVFIAQAELGRILSFSRSSGEITELFTGLAAPGNILVTYRDGVGCPGATNVLIIEEGANQISLAIPSENLLISPWVPAQEPTDLTILPPASVFGGATSVLIETVAAAGGASSDVAAVDVSDLYDAEPVNPPVSLPAASLTTAPGPDLAVTVASTLVGTSTDVDVFFRPGPDDALPGSGPDEVALLLLTIDYDENNLSLDGGTLAAALQASLPAGFSLIGFHDPGDTDGEIGLLILDQEAPFATLEEGSILRLSLAVEPTASGTADIRFTDPGPQLLDLLLLQLNEAVSGGVQVQP